MSANREAALEQQIAQQASKNIQLEQELVDFLRHGREGSPERPPPHRMAPVLGEHWGADGFPVYVICDAESSRCRLEERTHDARHFRLL